MTLPIQTRTVRLTTAALCAVLFPGVAAGQVVHDPQPAKPGAGASWKLELPASWNVEQVTFDPLGIGLDTFVERLYHQTGDCPAGVTCWRGGVTLISAIQPEGLWGRDYGRSGNLQCLVRCVVGPGPGDRGGLLLPACGGAPADDDDELCAPEHGPARRPLD